jgi:hypothetical protein
MGKALPSVLGPTPVALGSVVANASPVGPPLAAESTPASGYSELNESTLVLYNRHLTTLGPRRSRPSIRFAEIARGRWAI